MKEVDRLFDSFSSNKHAPPYKKLLHQCSSDSPHVGYWDKAGIGVSSSIFLKDGKPAFNKPSPSQNGWLVSIGAVRHVWRMLKEAGFKYLETRNLNQDPLENTFGVFFFPPLLSFHRARSLISYILPTHAPCIIKTLYRHIKISQLKPVP